MKSMCCLCIQFTHENTSERTILHQVSQKNSGGGQTPPGPPPFPGMVDCTAKKASYAPASYRSEACCIGLRRSRSPIEQTENLWLGQYEKHHVMIPLLINQSNITRDFSLRLYKRLADSDLAVFGLTGIGPMHKISILDWFLPYWLNESFYIVMTDLTILRLINQS